MDQPASVSPISATSPPTSVSSPPTSVSSPPTSVFSPLTSVSSAPTSVSSPFSVRTSPAIAGDGSEVGDGVEEAGEEELWLGILESDTSEDSADADEDYIPYNTVSFWTLQWHHD